MKKACAALLFIAVFLASCGPARGGAPVVADPAEKTSELSPSDFDASGVFDGFYLKKDAKNGIGTDIVSFRKSAGRHCLFIPGRADADECRLYWKGRLYLNGTEVLSGKEKLPSPGSETEFSFSEDGKGEKVSLTVCKGSPDVLPIFISDVTEPVGLEGKTTVDFATLNNKKLNAEKELYCACTAHIGENTYYASLKGRGNTSWDYQQRSFNIRFYRDCKDGFYSKNRDVSLIDGVLAHAYSLIAFSSDGSLMKNYIGYKLAEQMGLGVACRYADLWVNGEYHGLYLLTEKNDSMTPEGGYTLEFDNRPDPDEHQCRVPGLYGAEGDGFITVKKNDNDSEPELRGVRGYNFIDSFIIRAWKAARSDGEKYVSYFDLESWAKYYILEEFVKDHDVYGNAYMHLGPLKSAGDVVKIKAGPLWDMDHALGCANETGLELELNDWYIQKRPQRDFWLDVLDNHGSFVKEVEKQRLKWRNLFASAADMVNECRKSLALSAEMHHKRWAYPRPSYWSSYFLHDTEADKGVYKATAAWDDYADNLVMFLEKRSEFIFSTRFYIAE